MDRAQDLSSSKQSIDGYGTFGDEVILMPLQSQTLNTLAGFAKGALNFTSIEQLREVLIKDSSLSRFVEKFAKQGAQIILKEHAILSNRKRKNVDEEFKETTSGGEEAMIVVGSENEDGTAIDEANDDDGITNVDAETNDDMEHDAETDDDMGHADDNKRYWIDVFRAGQSPIEKLIRPNGCLWAIAEKVANDEDLVAIAEKLLKPFENDDELTNFNAQQFCETVELFWENKNIHKALCDELIENPFLFRDFSRPAERFVEEPPEDRIARIKTDTSFSKVFERDDPVAKLSGVLSILVGYWMGQKLLAKLSKLLYSPDLPSDTGRHIKDWGRTMMCCPESRECKCYIDGECQIRKRFQRKR